jgi:acyl carrier protein
MAGLTNMPLGGSNAIGLRFGRKECYWAFVDTLNILPLPGIGSRADEAMNSGHIQCFYVTCNAMSEFTTYELSNVDPDDISDVLVKVEKSFDFKFGHTELKDVKTFGELSDIITNKVQGDNSNDCTTQQAFYKLRDAIADTLTIDKKFITQDTELQELFPRNCRRQKVKEINVRLDAHLEILEIKEWLKWTYLAGIIISLVGFFFKWQFALTGLAFFSFFGWATNKYFATEIVTQTVGQIAEKFARENYLKARRNKKTINKIEIAKKVQELFKAELGLDDKALTREATFV